MIITQSSRGSKKIKKIDIIDKKNYYIKKTKNIQKKENNSSETLKSGLFNLCLINSKVYIKKFDQFLY